MPRTSGNWTSGWAETDAKLNDIFSVVFANGSSLVARATPHGRFRGKWYSVFVCGVYKGNYYCPMFGTWEMVFPLDIGTGSASFYIVEAGLWDGYDSNDSIGEYGHIKDWEESHAKRLRISWDSDYFVDGPAGDTQLSSLTVTGAKRGVNVYPVAAWPSRALLTYSITTVGTTHIVRIWNGNNIVAEGSRVGDGLVTCSQINDSGLIVEGILTYTADLQQGTAEINLSWPGSYEIHYSTSALVFPRTAEFTLYDDGSSDSWSYLSPTLSGAVYHYNVIAVSDESVKQTVIVAPADSPKTIFNLPAGPTITSVTGSAAATVVTWTQGEAGCSYTIYYSHAADQPINMGTWVTPVPFTVPVGATSATLPPITGWETIDQSVYTNSLSASITSEVAALNAIWTVGETGFLDQLTLSKTAILAAIETFEEALDWNLQDAKDDFTAEADSIYQSISAATGVGLTAAEWKTATTDIYSEYLMWLGEFYDNAPGKWTLPDGSISTASPPSLEYSMIDIAKPLTHRPTFCALIRATKQSTGLQEAADGMYCWQYDDAGDVLYPMPNQANLEEVGISGLVLTVYAEYFPADEAATPDYIDFYCVSATSSINYAIPATSVALGADVGGVQRATITYTTTSGYKKIAVKARKSTTGARSADAYEQYIYVNGNAPDGVTNLQAEVISGEDV